VDGDGSEHPRFPSRHLRRPARGLQVPAHLDDTAHADARGTVEVLAVVEKLVPVGDLEVSVIVVDTHRERRRKRRIAQVARFTLFRRGVTLTDRGLRVLRRWHA
jgi:hypothetical protein